MTKHRKSSYLGHSCVSSSSYTSIYGGIFFCKIIRYEYDFGEVRQICHYLRSLLSIIFQLFHVNNWTNFNKCTSFNSFYNSFGLSVCSLLFLWTQLLLYQLNNTIHRIFIIRLIVPFSWSSELKSNDFFFRIFIKF